MQKELQLVKDENDRLKVKLECNEDLLLGKKDVLLELDLEYSTLKEECDVKSDLEDKICMLTNESVLLHVS